MNLGESIRDVRLRAGLTQKHICERVEIAQGYYSIIETGKGEPSIAVLQKIADALGVPLYFIFWQATQKKDIKNKHRALHDSISEQMVNYLVQIKLK